MRLLALCGGSPACEGPADTLLFLDVDGVLNVSIDDLGRKPISFSPENVQAAVEIEKASDTVSVLVETILSAYNRPDLPGDDNRAKYVSTMPLDICDLMVDRLAQIIQAAGEGCTVVLSSSWRDPRYAKSLRQLEELLQACLGQKFRFHHKTALVQDSHPAARLRAIGEFLKTQGNQLLRGSKWRRVLVLEDFCAHALDGWRCDGVQVDSTAAAEKYLMSKLLSPSTASVKLVHTFDRWKTPAGVEVRIGTGLDNEHFDSAMQFLGSTAPLCRG